MAGWRWSDSSDEETSHEWRKPDGELMLPPRATRGMQLVDDETDLAILTCLEFDDDLDFAGCLPTAEQRDLLAAAPDLLVAATLLKGALQKVLLHAPGYDWNADPLSLTLVTGTAFEELDKAFAKVRGEA